MQTDQTSPLHLFQHQRSGFFISGRCLMQREYHRSDPLLFRGNDPTGRLIPTDLTLAYHYLRDRLPYQISRHRFRPMDHPFAATAAIHLQGHQKVGTTARTRGRQPGSPPRGKQLASLFT